MNLLERAKTQGAQRSSKWPAFRDKFLKGKVCAVCSGKGKLQAHHIKPFHLYPELELVESNLMPLCESGANGANCHLFVGHLGSFKSINKDAITDAHVWGLKIKDRP